MKITVIKGKHRRTFKRIASARRWVGRARKVAVIVAN